MKRKTERDWSHLTVTQHGGVNVDLSGFFASEQGRKQLRDLKELREFIERQAARERRR